MDEIENDRDKANMPNQCRYPKGNDHQAASDAAEFVHREEASSDAPAAPVDQKPNSELLGDSPAAPLEADSSDAALQGDITIALQDISSGDTNAIGRLLPLVYFELRQVARLKLRNERPDHTLQATALVHEVIVKILGRSTPCTWENRRQFFRSAATVMRQILIDSARAKKRIKRAGTVQLTQDYEDQAVHNLVDLDLILDLDTNLALLEQEDAQAAELVKLRLYAGLSVAEAAEVIGISRSKAYEDWMFARFWFTNHGKNLMGF